MAKLGRPKIRPSHKKVQHFFGLERPYSDRLKELSLAKGKEDYEIIAYVVRNYIDKQSPNIIAEKIIEKIVEKNEKRKEAIDKDHEKMEQLKKIRGW